MKIQTLLLLEYDRARAIAAVGPNLGLAALRDAVGLYSTPLNQLADKLKDNEMYSRVITEPAGLDILILNTIVQLEHADPTPNKKYTQWMARLFASSQNIVALEDITSTVATYLAKFDKLNRKKRIAAPFNDINRYKTFDDFLNKMDEYEDVEDEDANKGNAEKLYDSPEVTVIHPLDEPAACRYGRGTRWCTAATHGTNYFGHYNRQGPLYILIPKTPERDGEKYQLHFPSDQFMNEDDDEVGLSYILKTRFPELFDFFKERHPEYFDRMLEFAPNEILAPLTKKIKELLMDYVYEMLSDWETNDDYYYQWLRSEGYVNDDDEIVDDAPSYLSYNDEARGIFDTIEDAIDLTPDRVREYANEANEEDGSVLDIHNIEEVYKQSLKDVQDRSNQYSIGDVIGFIKKNLYVSKNTDGTYTAVVKRNGETIW